MSSSPGQTTRPIPETKKICGVIAQRRSTGTPDRLLPAGRAARILRALHVRFQDVCPGEGFGFCKRRKWFTPNTLKKVMLRFCTTIRPLLVFYARFIKHPLRSRHQEHQAWSPLCLGVYWLRLCRAAYSVAPFWTGDELIAGAIEELKPTIPNSCAAYWSKAIWT